VGQNFGEKEVPQMAAEMTKLVMFQDDDEDEQLDAFIDNVINMTSEVSKTPTDHIATDHIYRVTVT